jgi:MFS family permease
LLADRIGPRLTFGVFGALFAAGTVLTGFVGGMPSLIAARALVGFGEGPSLAVATRAIADWLPRARWSFAQGLTHAFSRVANAVTAPLVAGMIVLCGWRGAFIGVGVLTVFWVALWVWYYRDDPRTHPAITPGEVALLDGAPRAERPLVPVLRLVRRMVPVIITDFCYGWTLFVVLNWLPSFFRGAFHFDLASSTAFTMGTFIAGIAGDILGGVLSARLLARTGDLRRARRDLIACALTASAICYSPILLSHDVTVVTAAVVLGFFCMELAIAPLWSVPMDITPEHAGAASGMMNFGAAAAGIVSPWAFGAIVDRTGDWNLPFGLTVLLLLLGAGSAFFMRPERRFAPSEPA